MNLKKKYVQTLLQDRSQSLQKNLAVAYAPSNIALIKYWGKRNTELNLPMTSSLSVGLGEYGASTSIECIEKNADEIWLNHKILSNETGFAKRATEFLDLFRQKNQRFCIRTESRIPIAAGLASSAAGFAALTRALNTLYDWQCDDQTLSLLARLGSGSACRSLWQGFVEWHQGNKADGFDSYAEPLAITWPDFRIGLLIEHTEEKALGSRDAMLQTVATSPFYHSWPHKVAEDLIKLKQALQDHDFMTMGSVAESNALAMHATMLTADPAILYWQPTTLLTMQKVWELRATGIALYFTEDAGPNLKLLFLADDDMTVREYFPKIKVISPFEGA